MEDKVLVPPIKSQGIKTKLIGWIKSKMPDEIHSCYIEPFMGTGVVGFNIAHPDSKMRDVNPHIINFYAAVKTGEITAEIARAYLEKEGKVLSEKGYEHYLFIRERFNEEFNPLDFLFLSRSCFNGIVRFNKKGKYNVPFCKKPDRFSKSLVTKIVNQIIKVEDVIGEDWDFNCQDFRETIKEAREGDFIYLDPPYAGRHTNYYDLWSEESEADLVRLLKETPAKFMLSTWSGDVRKENPAMLSWEGFNVHKREHYYHVGPKKENRFSMTEALITNFE